MAHDKVYLVIVKMQKQDNDFVDESLEEMKALSESAGGIITGWSSANLPHPDPSHFIRGGKLAEVRTEAERLGANVLIFNADLSPVQARNIESSTGLRAVDRTGLILDIFARRAKSGEGKLQVELAQLNYLLPRLVGMGVIMSRLGGGIGTRGPGEQKLEVDRRRIRERIQRLKKDLERLAKHRALIRDGRRQKKFVQVSLVGYTNAGKSTLLNTLTGADAYVEDKLFATLDPKTRVKVVQGESILFTDTVGFIRNLPHTLVDAFHATLEEVAAADILIHVIDASDPRYDVHERVVAGVLQELKADHKLPVYALNKADLLSEDEQRRILQIFPQGVLVSAKDNLGIPGLLNRVVEVIDSLEPQVTGKKPERPLA